MAGQPLSSGGAPIAHLDYPLGIESDTDKLIVKLNEVIFRLNNMNHDVQTVNTRLEPVDMKATEAYQRYKVMQQDLLVLNLKANQLETDMKALREEYPA